MALLILSLYYGWKTNGVLVGQLLSKKSLDVILDPLTLNKLNQYAYFQFHFFILAIISLGLIFVYKSVSLFSAVETKNWVFYLTIGIIVIIGVAVTCNYIRINKNYEDLKNRNEITMKKQKKDSDIQDINKQKEDKVLSENLLKEMIHATRDITKLLINWAILLLTGLGYIVIRIMKFIE